MAEDGTDDDDILRRLREVSSTVLALEHVLHDEGENYQRYIARSCQRQRAELTPRRAKEESPA